MDHPQFSEKYMSEVRQLIVGDRIHFSDVALPSFDPHAPVGTVAQWDENTVIIRESEYSWKFAEKK